MPTMPANAPGLPRRRNAWRATCAASWTFSRRTREGRRRTSYARRPASVASASMSPWRGACGRAVSPHAPFPRATETPPMKDTSLQPVSSYRTNRTEALGQSCPVGDQYLSDKDPVRGPVRPIGATSVPKAGRRTETRPVAPEFHLRLRCPHDASDPGGIRRLRAALKRLLRSYGLKALEVRPAEVDIQSTVNPAPDATEPPAGTALPTPGPRGNRADVAKNVGNGTIPQPCGGKAK